MDRRGHGVRVGNKLNVSGQYAFAVHKSELEVHKCDFKLFQHPTDQDSSLLLIRRRLFHDILLGTSSSLF